MVVRAAGVLPITTYEGENYFLLGEEGILSREWSDFGGRIDKGEVAAILTAMREAHEESRGVLGSHRLLFFKLINAKEKILARSYLSYLSNWSVSSLEELPRLFRASPMRSGPFGEMHRIEWVKATEIYKAVIQYIPRSGQTVCTNSRKQLRPRLTSVVRRSRGYQAYCAAQVELITSRYEDMSPSYVNRKADAVPVIKLRNGRVFAVSYIGKGSRSLLLENRTWMNFQYRQSLWQRIASICAWLFWQKPHEPTWEEREAIYHALRGESRWGRLQRSWLSEDILAVKTI